MQVTRQRGGTCEGGHGEHDDVDEGNDEEDGVLDEVSQRCQLARIRRALHTPNNAPLTNTPCKDTHQASHDVLQFHVCVYKWHAVLSLIRHSAASCRALTMACRFTLTPTALQRPMKAYLDLLGVWRQICKQWSFILPVDDVIPAREKRTHSTCTERRRVQASEESVMHACGQMWAKVAP